MDMSWLTEFWNGTRESAVMLLTILDNQALVSAEIQGYGVWGPAVLALAQVVQVLVAVIPGHVFLIAAGYVYGFLNGFLLNLASVVAASQLAFLLARKLGRPFLDRFVSPKLLDRWYRLSAQRGFLFFTVSFVLPVFPTDIMNFVGGLSGISRRKFLAANLLGRIPGAVMLTLIGSHGLSFSRATWAALAVGVALLYTGGHLTLKKLDLPLTQPARAAKEPSQ